VGRLSYGWVPYGWHRGTRPLPQRFPRSLATSPKTFAGKVGGSGSGSRTRYISSVSLLPIPRASPKPTIAHPVKRSCKTCIAHPRGKLIGLTTYDCLV